MPPNPGGGWPTGGTLLAGVIGTPVRHSLSPVIFNAAFAACGMDWAFLAFEVDTDAVAAVLAGARGIGVRGLSVTMPLKGAAAAIADELTPTAEALGAVNSVTFTGGRAVGDNTDGAGFLSSVAAAGVVVTGAKAVVLGAGGAARAIIAALGQAGAGQVTVVNRTAATGGAAAVLAGSSGRLGDPGDVAAADLVVNATPVGMAGTPGAGSLPAGAEHLRDGQAVVDLVYHPVATPFLIEAARRGATVVDGVGMLVHQAARQFENWTGREAPIDVMTAAARAALGP